MAALVPRRHARAGPRLQGTRRQRVLLTWAQPRRVPTAAWALGRSAALLACGLSCELSCYASTPEHRGSRVRLSGASPCNLGVCGGAATPPLPPSLVTPGPLTPTWVAAPTPRPGAAPRPRPSVTSPPLSLPPRPSPDWATAQRVWAPRHPPRPPSHSSSPSSRKGSAGPATTGGRPRPARARHPSCWVGARSGLSICCTETGLTVVGELPDQRHGAAHPRRGTWHRSTPTPAVAQRWGRAPHTQPPILARPGCSTRATTG